MKVSHLYKLAAGLNIEGGDPFKRILNDHKGKKSFIWANIILVLDRPLVDNIVFDDILNDNRFPLLENRIAEINEHHFIAAFLIIIQYYVKNGSNLLYGENDSNIKITIHLHQDIVRKELCNIIDKHLHELTDISKTIEIEYITDTPTYVQTITDYSSTDILISLSQCAGLSPEYIPGTLLIADTFVPYSIEPSTIHTDQEYKVENDLILRLQDILKSEFNQPSVDYINNNYESYNPEKYLNRAHKLTENDFIKTKILQVDKLWNPKDGNDLVKIN